MRQAGATRFELAVCTTLVALLAGGMLFKLRAVRANSERAAVEHVAGALKTALAARAARARDAGELAALADENPMAWLSRKPPTYIGEYYSPSPGGLPKGSWLFDRTDKSIVYLFNHDTFSHGTSKLLKFKVKFVGTPKLQQTDRPDSMARGLVLEEVDPPDVQQD